MARSIIVLFLFLFPTVAGSQVAEHFDDGELSANPSWTGTASAWTVNSDLQLQSTSAAANSGFFLSTPNTLSVGVQWDWYLRLAFNTSSNNYVDVFLLASAADPGMQNLTGYFVRIGNTQDEISLYRRDANGINTKLIDGVDGRTNFSDNSLRIRVIRDAGLNFRLFTDITGTGAHYQPEGEALDATYSSSLYFAIYIRQSTPGFFGKHYFDEISIAPYQPDLSPPQLITVRVTSDSSLVLTFSEPLEALSAQEVSLYDISPSLNHPVQAYPDGSNTERVVLLFNQHFISGTDYSILVHGIKDLSNNILVSGSGVFSWYYPVRFDIIINEVQADPSPPVGLPSAEYIELKNRSSHTIDLSGWRISTTPVFSSPFPDLLLEADSFLILASPGQAPLFAGWGRVIGISGFPSLDNKGDTLRLLSADNRTIHGLAYSDNWHQDIIKKNGGWSLEMIDASHPCSSLGNWASSLDPSGGTPGRKNSVAGILTNPVAPKLLNTYSLDSITLVARFTETLDSSAMAGVNHYFIDDAHPILSATLTAPLFREIKLGLFHPMSPHNVYVLRIQNVTDCDGQMQGTPVLAKAGLPEVGAERDVVINEILFNPRQGSFDFVEIYNRSKKIMDVSHLIIAGRSSNGQLSMPVNLSTKPLYLFPGEYLVVNEEAATLKSDYFVANPDGVLGLPSFPSLPDDKGRVVIVNKNGSVLDELSYSEDWHFALISNKEGVSLERIDPEELTQKQQNWHSSSSTSGYATPTYRNSQYRNELQASSGFRIQPSLFSPDNDGMDDLTNISYKLSTGGYMANIRIFNTEGNLVRYLVKNELLGTGGNWNWDGLDDNRGKLVPGIYIIHIELFNLQGKKEVIRKTVILVRK